MKKTKILTALLFSFFSVCWGQEMPKNLKKKWSYSKMIKFVQDGREGGLKIFKRYVTAQGSTWPVASMSMTFVRYKEEKINLKSVAISIKDGFPEVNWTQREKRGLIILEGKWDFGNRYMTLFLYKKGENTFVTQSSTIRMGYLSSVYHEVEKLHFSLRKSFLEKKLKKTSFIEKFWWPKKAFAQDGGTDLLDGANLSSDALRSAGEIGLGGAAEDFSGLASLPELNGSSGVDLSGVNLDALTDSISTINPNLSINTPNIDGATGAINNLANAGNNLATAGNNLANAGNNLAGSIDTGVSNVTNPDVINNAISTGGDVVSNSLPVVNNAVNTANNAINTTNNAINTVNNALPAVNNAITTGGNVANNAINTANNAIPVINNAINTGGNVANNAINTVNNAINTGGQVAGQVVNTANNVVRIADLVVSTVTNPQKLAMIVGAAYFAKAAGTALGGIMVNLVIDGVAALAKKVYHLIRDTEGKKIRWKKFQEAKKLWNKQRNYGLKLEKSLDKFLTNHYYVKGLKNQLAKSQKEGHLSSEDYLAALNIKEGLRKKKKDYKFLSMRYGVKAQDPNVSDLCSKVYFNLHEDYKKKFGDLQKVFAYIEQSKIEEFTYPATFCEQLEALRDKIIDTENFLNEARIAIVNGTHEWKRKEKENIKQLRKDVERINKTYKRRKDKWMTKRLLRHVKRIKKKNEKLDKADWISKCIEGKNPLGKEILEEVKTNYRTFRYYRRKKRCKEKYDQVAYLLHKSRISESEKIINRLEEDRVKDFEEGKMRRVPLNDTTLLLGIEVMTNWFKRLELELLCHGQMENPAYTEKCKKFAPTLYHHYMARKRAVAVYDDECREYYDNLSRNITEGIEDDGYLENLLDELEADKVALNTESETEGSEVISEEDALNALSKDGDADTFSSEGRED